MTRWGEEGIGITMGVGAFHRGLHTWLRKGLSRVREARYWGWLFTRAMRFQWIWGFGYPEGFRVQSGRSSEPQNLTMGPL